MSNFRMTEEQLPTFHVVMAVLDILFSHAMVLALAKEDQRRILWQARPQLSQRPYSRFRTKRNEIWLRTSSSLPSDLYIVS
mmetsp:Transcript_15004/g.61138  ORF Transcript_15004/g.61138 Transcript_15004/m.61138 type:complete len:81 (-) Transcript_15004:2820-3062(-)